MDLAVAAVVGIVIGAGLALLVLVVRRRHTRELAQCLLERAEADRSQEMQAVVNQLQATFGDLSQKALSANSEQFLRLAETKLAAQSKEGAATLEEKKKLIDETVKQIAARLAEVGNTLQTMEKDRRQSQGSLVEQLKHAAQVTATLQDTTAHLREALANPQRRGQWGERMAEDVLRLAGFVDGINYDKQTTIEGGNRPDFTFYLPQERCVNMDVKFPLPNYLKYLDAEEGAAREQCKREFLRDVRARIREVTTREYIDPAGGTVDYVLVFIPNEQVYGFIHEHDPALLDEALRQKVVLCSPLTLYAMLAVIRQTAENFRLEQTSREILALLGAFNREWQKFLEHMDRMGKALESAQKHYDALTTTRQRKLERQLDKIENLRTQENVALPATTAPDD